jgi:hypothetical protein
MLRFARESGIDLSSDLRSDIAALDALLKPLGLPSVSDLPSNLVGGVETPKCAEAVAGANPANIEPMPADPGPEAGPVLGADPVPAAEPAPAVKPTTASATELALKVHGVLSKLVAPATALTLRATEPRPGRHGVFARMPKIVTWAAAAALGSAIGFVVSTTMIAQRASGERPAVERNGSGPAGSPSKPAAPTGVTTDAGEKP